MYHKLYEHIRLGALLRPQAFGAYFWEGKSCAMGAAYESLHGAEAEQTTEAEQTIDFKWSEFPVAEVAVPARPTLHGCCWHNSGTIRAIVQHLNDGHCWTRNQIADWLEPIEEALGREHPEWSGPKPVAAALTSKEPEEITA